jgi:PAS domain S-box-containing protein
VHEIICDQNGKPVDYRFLSVNAAFGKMTGLNAADIIGRTALEVLPEIEPIWIERYGHVALTREPQQFVNYSNSLKKYFGVRAFSPEAGKFATVISDVTERIQAEEDRKRFQEELEKRVALRTEELSAKTAELERINRVFVDRELRMRELKKRMEELEKKVTSDEQRATRV